MRSIPPTAQCAALQGEFTHAALHTCNIVSRGGIPPYLHQIVYDIGCTWVASRLTYRTGLMIARGRLIVARFGDHRPGGTRPSEWWKIMATGMSHKAVIGIQY
jgi:hypothetical protein